MRPWVELNNIYVVFQSKKYISVPSVFPAAAVTQAQCIYFGVEIQIFQNA